MNEIKGQLQGLDSPTVYAVVDAFSCSGRPKKTTSGDVIAAEDALRLGCSLVQRECLRAVCLKALMESVSCLNSSASVVSVQRAYWYPWQPQQGHEYCVTLAQFKDTVKIDDALKTKRAIALFCGPLALTTCVLVS